MLMQTIDITRRHKAGCSLSVLRMANCAALLL